MCSLNLGSSVHTTPELVNILAHFLVSFQPMQMPVHWLMNFPSCAMAETLTTERAASRISAFSLGLETLSAVYGSLGFTTVGRFLRGSFAATLEILLRLPDEGSGWQRGGSGGVLVMGAAGKELKPSPAAAASVFLCCFSSVPVLLPPTNSVAAA